LDTARHQQTLIFWAQRGGGGGVKTRRKGTSSYVTCSDVDHCNKGSLPPKEEVDKRKVGKPIGGADLIPLREGGPACSKNGEKRG